VCVCDVITSTRVIVKLLTICISPGLYEIYVTPLTYIDAAVCVCSI